MLSCKASNRLFLILFILFCSVHIFAQVRISSPYSLFGIGQLRVGSYNVALMSMGGIRNAMSSPYYVNYSNPASYTAFDSTSFVFEGAVLTNYTNLKTSELSENATYGSLGYILLGFPISRWWKSSLGLLPFSDVGYNMVEERSLTNIGNTQTAYEGSGGINNLFWGNGFKITKNFSLGFNAIYYFGSIDKTRSVYFPDSLLTYLNTRIINKIRISDLSLNFGALYKKTLKNDLVFSTGLSFGYETNISAEREYLSQTFQGGINSVEYFVDTITYEPKQKGNIKIPTYTGVGFALESPDHWLIGADFNWQNWEKYSAFGYSDSLKNSFDVAIGGYFIPDKHSIHGYFKKVTYRFGGRYSTTYLNLKNKQISEFGISFGLGLPLMHSKSTLNLGFEFGRRGTTSNNLIQESFIKFTLGISIYERWFIKSKYH